MYADTYAMVLFKNGDFKKAYKYISDAAINVNNYGNPDYNKTFAQIAPKAISAKKYTPILEKMVENGGGVGEVREQLKKAYLAKNPKGNFEAYYAELSKDFYQKMLEEIKKSMLEETAPQFALYDLDGKEVDIKDLKGSTVVVDFWATWCGPCKASFPGMQRMVEKYKGNQHVKFVFIDTWERGDEKAKNAAEFVTSNNYDFHVLMDTEDKVVSEFKVDGIPTKFVIDPNGVIRFKSVGFNGSDEKLVMELSAMIELASDTKKAF